MRLLVSGRVQNVGYRQFCKTIAKRLGISGWVRNLSDGRVEIVAVGKKGKVDVFLNKLKKGSLLSEVNNISIISKTETPEKSLDGNFKKLEAK